MKRTITVAVATIALGLGAWSWFDDPRSPLTGEARIIDGDTVDVAGTRIRLEGVDAPEMNQECHDASGASYLCGEHATAALERLTHGKRISCEPTGNDRYGRTLAICRDETGLDLNSEMVRLRRISSRPTPQELAQ